jgi:S1-C subfamily serine protease
MKRLIVIPVLLLALLGGAGCSVYYSSSKGLEGGNLPPCSGPHNALTWSNCYGMVIYGPLSFSRSGNKYIGEFLNSRPHGQGTYYHLRNDQFKGDKYVGEFSSGRREGKGTFYKKNGRKYVGEWENDRKVSPSIAVKKAPPQMEKKPQQIAKRPMPKPSPPQPKTSSSGSGFFVSKSGHVITNQHVVDSCRKVTVGDKAESQVTADVLGADRRNDLALLLLSSMKMASAETQSLIRKLRVEIVPLAAHGLLRDEDVELGESVLVAGFPYGEIFSNSIKVTGGMVSANRGLGDDTGQFQIDAAVQPGNSGGPIYDENGNIVGVVVAQLNKMKFAETTGSLPENVNFGIKASTVRQFLNASGLPTKWSKRSKAMGMKDLAKIAKMQTVMVVCHR